MGLLLLALPSCRILSRTPACTRDRDCPRDTGLGFCYIAPGEEVGVCVGIDPNPDDDDDDDDGGVSFDGSFRPDAGSGDAGACVIEPFPGTSIDCLELLGDPFAWCAIQNVDGGPEGQALLETCYQACPFLEDPPPGAPCAGDGGVGDGGGCFVEPIPGVPLDCFGLLGASDGWCALTEGDAGQAGQLASLCAAVCAPELPCAPDAGVPADGGGCFVEPIPGFSVGCEANLGPADGWCAILDADAGPQTTGFAQLCLAQCSDAPTCGDGGIVDSGPPPCSVEPIMGVTIPCEPTLGPSAGWCSILGADAGPETTGLTQLCLAQCAPGVSCVPDAGPTDAGDVDAGDFDAGDLDAGGLDAGGLDAGEQDAGDLDSGPLDAT
jgi:hypothetical protein